MKQTQIRLFRQILRRFERLVATQLKESGCCQGVSLAQCHALLEIEMQESPGLNDLAQKLGLDKSTLSRTMEGLVNIGLVQRDVNPSDRRGIVLKLTQQGRQTCDRINEQNDALYSRIIDCIPEDDRDSALKGFKLLVDAMALETESGCQRS